MDNIGDAVDIRQPAVGLIVGHLIRNTVGIFQLLQCKSLANVIACKDTSCSFADYVIIMGCFRVEDKVTQFLLLLGEGVIVGDAQVIPEEIVPKSLVIVRGIGGCTAA